MRPARGLPLAIRVALHALLLALSFAGAPHVSHAQAAATLPKSWNDAVAKLADEVAAAMSPAAVTLQVENISSLDASNAAAIAAAFRAQLQRHSFSLAPQKSAAQSAIQLQLSLAESAAENVWVMQILTGQGEENAVPVMIVAAPKADLADAATDDQSLSLEKRFVWKQSGKFLDFALLKGAASGESTLLVLETNHLAVYKQSGSGWQLSHTSPLPQATSLSRDPHGTINLKEGKISVKGFECVGDSDLAAAVQCKAAKTVRLLRGPFVEMPGLPNSVGTPVPEKCREELVLLFTGESDWTQSDFIRGYLTRSIPSAVVPSGNAVEFAGPVLALQADPEGNSARAVVHNLKTGEYEAYVVTATCSN